MNLDKHSFGKAPAAMYLVVLLNERDDPRLARKIGKALSGMRELLLDLEFCHTQTDELKFKSLGKILTMTRANIVELCAAHTEDVFIWHIVANILIGETRVLTNRVAAAAIKQRQLQRGTPHGVSVPLAKAMPTPGELTTEEKNAQLQARSAAYLKRKGKVNTLY